MLQQNVNLSVLMSTYEKDNPVFLAQSLQSLLEQSLKACEIVLVEDGVLNPALTSTIDKFRQSLNIKSVKLATNMGLGTALATGLRNCSGSIVARMDTDDIALPERFKKQYDFLSDNPDITLLGGHISEFDENPGEPLHNRTVKLTHDDIVKASWMRNPFNHMTVMFRKAAILNVGNYQDIPSFEDYDLWLRVISAGYKCQNLDEILVHTRAGNELIDRRSGFKYITSEFNALRTFKKYGVIPKPILILSLISRLIIRALPKTLIKATYSRLRSKPRKAKRLIPRKIDQ